jgi:lipid A oxidase
MTTLAEVLWSTRPASRAANQRNLRLLDWIGSAVAAAALAMVAASSVMEQNPADPAEAERSSDAGPDAPTLAPPASEYMFAGYAGAPYTYSSDVTVHKEGKHSFTVKDVDWIGKPFENPIYYGARIVRWFEGGRTGTMLDFTHSKAIAPLDVEKAFSGTINGAPAPERAKLGDVFRRLEASHGHNMLTLNGLFRLPSLGLRLYPYVGVGAGVSLPHSEVQMIKDPGRTYEYQYAGPVGQALIGIEFRVPRMSYFFEYKFTLASYQMPLTHQDGDILFTDLWRQFKRWLSGEEPPGGFLWTNLVSHQGIAGLGVRFSTAPAAAP